jgi:hypothetical protein
VADDYYGHMGFPEPISQYEVTQELSLLAQRSGERSDFLGCYLAYSELFSISGSVGDLVMMTESKRLIGMLDFVGYPKELSIQSIVNTLGQAGEALVAKAILLKENLISEDIAVISENFKNSKVVNQSLSTRKLFKADLKNSINIVEENVYGIENASHHEKSLIFKSYIADVPPLAIASSVIPVTSKSRQIRIPDVEVLEMQKVLMWAGSDLIRSEGVLFTDSGTADAARFRNTYDDERILAVSQDKVLRLSVNDKEPLSMGSIFYAAYPTTEAWGEWFTFVLCRLAVLSHCFPNRRMTIAILNSVPKEFVLIAENLFPDFNFIGLERGQEILADTAYFIPSWYSANCHEHWSMGGDLLRLQFEFNISNLLRRRFDKTIPDSILMPRKVFYNRTGARYRQGSAESILSLLAEKHRYTSVNMGGLSIFDQVNVSRSAVRSFGQCGSNWDLVAITARTGHKSLIVHHDRPHEWQAIAWMYGAFSNNPPSFVLGSRRVPSIGYGMESYHQPVELSKENIDFLDEQLGSESF